MCKKKKDRLKTKQKILYPLSFSQRRRKWKHVGCLWNLSRCGASAAGALNFQLRWMQRDKRGGKKHYWAAQSQISYIEIQIDMRHHQSESCRIKKKKSLFSFCNSSTKKSPIQAKQSLNRLHIQTARFTSHTQTHTHTTPTTWRWKISSHLMEKSHIWVREKSVKARGGLLFVLLAFFFFFYFQWNTSWNEMSRQCQVQKKNNKKTKTKEL